MVDVCERKSGSLHFSFIYLAHPRTVTGFSWRKTSKYMAKYTHTHTLVLTDPSVLFKVCDVALKD